MVKIIKRILKRWFKKKERYVLHWSDSFKAYQVYKIDIFSKPFYLSYHSPAYFVGWATTEDTLFDLLNNHESKL
jgi:hypothetical protein